MHPEPASHPTPRPMPKPAPRPTTNPARFHGPATDAFVADQARFVRGVALQVAAQLSLDCDVRDLEAFGYIGLLEARERFDAGRGIAFRSFAYRRVRGAIIDGVRDMAYLPRRAHARARAAAALEAEGEAVEGRKPLEAGAALRAIDGILGRVAAAYTVAACQEGEEGDPRATPERALLDKRRRAALRRALAALPPRERHLLEGHYLQGRRLDELAAEVGVSKSRGSRIHHNGLQILREKLAEC